MEQPPIPNLIALGATVIVFVTCVCFFCIKETNFLVAKRYDVPKFAFEDWFVYPSLVISLLGYSYVVLTSNVVSVSFILSSIVLLTSLVFIYFKLYFDIKPGTSVQTFAFNVIFNTLILIIFVIYNNKNYILATIALLPMFLLGGYYLYIGYLLSKK